MMLTELKPLLQNLSRADKLRAMHFLITELLVEEEDAASLLKEGVTYPSWSPYDSVGAAKVLLEALKEAERVEHSS